MTAKLKNAKMSDDNVRRIEAYGKGCTWYSTCRRCKKKLQGTFDDLLEHKCGEKS